MKKQFSLAALACTVLLTMLVPMTTLAAGGVDEGRFTDFDNLTWTTWDGVSTTYGRGPKFSDLHPEITDPEYFLKGYYEQEGGSWDLVYHRDPSTYNDDLAKELKSFLYSFDWIHSDELARATAVHDRIANGQNGNVYAHATGAFSVLMEGKGVCKNFSEEFMSLAKFVGLECVLYQPSELHQACMVKINGQWFATDPTDVSGPFLSNSKTYPVDYETELHRYEKVSDAKWAAYYVTNPDTSATLLAEAQQKTREGVITEADWARVNPLFTEIDTQIMKKTITTEEYEQKNVEILKSLLGK